MCIEKETEEDQREDGRMGYRRTRNHSTWRSSKLHALHHKQPGEGS